MEKMHENGEAAYVAIIGDVVGSRSISSRFEFQRNLERQLDRVNLDCEKELAAKFVITIGDEFQGLIWEPGAVMSVLIALETTLEGIPIRYGLGWGELSTPLRGMAVGMDGECFHNAREALEKRGKTEDRWVTVSGFDNSTDPILNGFLGLMGTVRREWTPKQMSTVHLARRKRTRREVAKTLGVAESTVSKALKAAWYEQVREAEQAVTLILEQFHRAARADSSNVRRSR